LGTVSNSASAGAGTLSISGTAANPTININFPASSSGGGGSAWTSGSSYSAGEIVSSDANLYVATTANTASVSNQPGTSGGAADWAGMSPGSSFSWVNSILNSQDSNTSYFPPTSGTPGWEAGYSETAGVGVVYSPASCTVRSLSVHAILQAAGYPDVTTFVVRHNDSATSMTCAVTVVSGNSSCSDTLHTFFVAAGDTLEFAVTQTNGNPTIFYSTSLICN
jgi:hypothetical protein